MDSSYLLLSSIFSAGGVGERVEVLASSFSDLRIAQPIFLRNEKLLPSLYTGRSTFAAFV
jgi:hypothetical protein